MDDPRTISEIRSLLEERRAFEARGLDDYVRQVDAELAARGYARPAAKRAKRERAVAPPTETR